MERNIKKSVMSVIVTVVMAVSAFPASTNAMTMTDAYRRLANITAPKQALADEAPTELSPLQVSEATPLDLWLEKLAVLESHGKNRIKIVDTNGKYSYGCLQFQEYTFRNYGQKYGLVQPGVDLESVIYDCNLQKAIAKHMIQDNYVLWQSWYTSVAVKDLGLPPRN